MPNTHNWSAFNALFFFGDSVDGTPLDFHKIFYQIVPR